MRELRRRAQRIVAEVAADEPDVVALAEVVSLALTVDRALLRAARRFELPRRGPDVEADLWHSALVGSSSATGVVLDTAVRDELRIRLRGDPERYDAAWELLEREHAWLPDTLRLEEWLAYEALRPGGPQRARERLAALEVEVSEQPGLAPWLAGLHARLPAAVGDPGGSAPGAGRGRMRGGETLGGGVRVDVRLLDGAVEFRSGTPSRAWRTLTLPEHAPPLVHVGETLVDLDDLPPAQPVGATRSVEIEALDGSRVTLARTGRSSPERRAAALRGHRGAVQGVAWSPDGRSVVSGGDDRVVRVWDVAAGREVAALSGHTGGVRGVAWSPDGRSVVSGGDDRVVRVWDVAAGREVAALSGHTGWVDGVAWSPDGGSVVSGGRDGVVRVWDVAAGREVAALSGHTGGVRGVAWSADGRSVVSGGVDGVVRVWDVVAGREVAALSGHTGWVRGVAWSPDGRSVVSGGDNRVVRVWDVAAGREVAALSGHAGGVWGVAWSADGRSVVSGGDDRVVRVWDVAAGREVAALSGRGGVVLGVAWSPDGRSVVSGGVDGVVRVWDVAARRVVAALAGHTGTVLGVAWSADGGSVVSGGFDGVVRVWDVAAGREVVALSGHAGAVWGVAWSPDGRSVVSGGDDGVVRVWDVAAGREVAAWSGHEGAVRGVAWSGDGRSVVSGGVDGVVRVWDVAAGCEAAALSGHASGVHGVAWSPDGRSVVSGGDDGVVRVWDVAAGREVVALSGHAGGALGVAWSPDGRSVVSGGVDKVARVWDVSAGCEVAAWSGQTGWGYGVAWSPDGRSVVSGWSHGGARVLDVAAGREVAALSGHEGFVYGAAWSPDGRSIVSGSADGVVRVWDVDAPASAVLRGPAASAGAVAGAALATADAGVRWTTLVGVGGAALPAALLASWLADADLRELLVRRGLQGLLAPTRRLTRAARRASGPGRLEHRLAAALAEQGIRRWSDLAIAAPGELHASALQLTLLDVATGRVVVLPRDAARLGIDLDEVGVARLVVAAMGGYEHEAIGGRRFASAQGRPLDLRALLAEQPAWQPAVLVDAGAAPHPRWPSGLDFTAITIPRPPVDAPLRPTRPQREVLWMVGADAARRAMAGRSPGGRPGYAVDRARPDPLGAATRSA